MARSYQQIVRAQCYPPQPAYPLTTTAHTPPTRDKPAKFGLFQLPNATIRIACMSLREKHIPFKISTFRLFDSESLGKLSVHQRQLVH